MTQTAGLRVWSDGMTKTHKPSLLSKSVAVVTLMLYCGLPHILLTLMALAFWRREALGLCIIIFSTLLLPAKPVLWPAFNQSWVFQTWREYFNFSYVWEEILDPKKRYVFTEFPHGAFPLGPLVAGTACQVIFPGFNIYSIAATSVFYVPGWRHFVAWIGSLPATTQNFKRLLRKGSVAVIVGGIAEIFLQHPTKERVKLQGRYGFVRVAIEEGSDGIVPVYHFGNSQLLDFGPPFLAEVSRKLRSAIGVFYGEAYLPLPRHRPIFMVCAKAIPVVKMSKDDPGFDAQVEAVHAKVVASLQDIYDRWKGEYGWSNRPLEIV